jgi:acyl-CoA thioesterase FadM
MDKEKKNYSTFESELQVRPDDIDMNGHVHNSNVMVNKESGRPQVIDADIVEKYSV